MKLYIENKKIGFNFSEKSKIEWVDTYYFAIDNNYKKGDESIQKVHDVLVKLLKGWKRKLLDLSNAVYLPYDFSDEYIGCIEVKKNDENHLKIVIGYTTKYCGYEISPSNFDNSFFISKEDFITDNNLILIKKEDLDDYKICIIDN